MSSKYFTEKSSIRSLLGISVPILLCLFFPIDQIQTIIVVYNRIYRIYTDHYGRIILFPDNRCRQTFRKERHSEIQGVFPFQ